MPLSGIVSLEDKIVYFCNAFLRYLPDPFKIIDDNYRIVWENRKYGEVHRLRHLDVVGEICYDILFQKDHPCSPCAATMARKADISKTLSISDHPVKSHMISIFIKLGLTTAPRPQS